MHSFGNTFVVKTYYIQPISELKCSNKDLFFRLMQTQQQQEATPSTGFKKLSGFFNKEEEGPNIGFKPTAAMAQRHEDALVSGKRPLFQFQVTRLRAWRTGYVRLLCLYDDHFYAHLRKLGCFLKVYKCFSPSKRILTPLVKHQFSMDLQFLQIAIFARSPE